MPSKCPQVEIMELKERVAELETVLNEAISSKMSAEGKLYNELKKTEALTLENYHIKNFIIEVRDEILYPVSQGDSELAETAEGLGSATVGMLKPQPVASILGVLPPTEPSNES